MIKTKKPPTMKRASYRFGVQWIAMNDNAGNGDTADEVAGYVSTGLLADLFGIETARVAKDVIRCRKKEGLEVRERNAE